MCPFFPEFFYYFATPLFCQRAKVVRKMVGKSEVSVGLYYTESCLLMVCSDYRVAVEKENKNGSTLYLFVVIYTMV